MINLIINKYVYTEKLKPFYMILNYSTFRRLIFLCFFSLYSYFSFAQYSEIWGVSFMGGTHDAGFLFKTDADGNNYQIMHHFDGVDGGDLPRGTLTEGADGLIYGITTQGGTDNRGVIFTFDRTYNSFRVVHHFAEATGKTLLLAPNGLFYVMSAAHMGSIYTFDPTTKILALAHDFPVSEGKMVFNDGLLTPVGDSLLYGTTGAGGSANLGVLFEYNIYTGTYIVKHHFQTATGKYPHHSLVLFNGKIYGTTSTGGNSSRGVLFEFDPNSDTYMVKQHLQSIHTSTTGLMLGSDGFIYGGVSIGGSFSGGGIYKYDPANDSLRFVVEYVDMGDPTLVTGSLMETFNGKMFGATRYGGTGQGLGVIFEYNPTTETAVTRQSLDDGFPESTILLEVGERTVTAITVTPSSGTITTDNGTLQLNVALQPVAASGQPVVWSVSDPSVANISSDGLLTAFSNGITTVIATANYGLGIADSATITVTNQDANPPVILIDSIAITSAADKITSFSNTLQLDSIIFPSNATNTSLSWFVSNNNIATISASGLLTPVNAGTVTVTAMANDGSGVYATKDIDVSNYITSITITPGTDTISTPYGAIDFDAIIAPFDATKQDIQWSVEPFVFATIDQDGLLRATNNGTVTITARSQDGSSVIATHEVVLINQNLGIPVTGIAITAPSDSITINGGTLQLTAILTPSNATLQTVEWISWDTTIVKVDQNGLVTAVGNGVVNIFVLSTSGPGTIKSITVINQLNGPFPLTDIIINPTTYNIALKGGTVQMIPQRKSVV